MGISKVSYILNNCSSPSQQEYFITHFAKCVAVLLHFYTFKFESMGPMM